MMLFKQRMLFKRILARRMVRKVLLVMANQQDVSVSEYVRGGCSGSDEFDFVRTSRSRIPRSSHILKIEVPERSSSYQGWRDIKVYQDETLVLEGSVSLTLRRYWILCYRKGFWVDELNKRLSLSKKEMRERKRKNKKEMRENERIFKEQMKKNFRPLQ